MNDREKQVEEARRTLASLSRETGLLGGARLSDDDADERDPAAIWAKRIGRALGLMFLVVLAINLFTGWFF